MILLLIVAFSSCDKYEIPQPSYNIGFLTEWSNGKHKVFTIKSDGNNMKALSNIPSYLEEFIELGAWSKNNERLCFIAESSGWNNNIDLYTMRVDGSSVFRK